MSALLVIASMSGALRASAQTPGEAPEAPAVPEQRQLRGDDEPATPEPSPEEDAENESPGEPASEGETVDDETAEGETGDDETVDDETPAAREDGDDQLVVNRGGGSSVGAAVRESADTGTSALRDLRGDDGVIADDGIVEEAIVSDRPDEPVSDEDASPVDDASSDAPEETERRRLRSYNRIGPFLMSTERSSLQPTLGVQMQISNEGEQQLFDATNLIRRMRFGLRARMLNDRLVARLQLNIWPDALELLDLWIDAYVRDWVSLRLGQSKIPFTQYRTASYTSLAIVDWSLITRYFGAERQIGGSAYGTINDRWIWDFGIYGGPNRRAAHGVKLTELYGEVPTNASDLADAGPTGNWHPEVVAHIGYHSEGIGVRQLTDPNGGDLRYAVDISMTGDAQPVTTDDAVMRIAPEVMLKYEHLSWMGLWYQSWFHPTTGGAEVGPYGLMTQATYRISRTWEVSGDYARTWIPAGLRADTRQRADDLIASAATPEEMTALTAQYADVGTLQGQQEVIVGLNVYIVGNSLKWQTDVTWFTDYLAGGQRAYRGRFRSQLQLSF